MFVVVVWRRGPVTATGAPHRREVSCARSVECTVCVSMCTVYDTAAWTRLDAIDACDAVRDTPRVRVYTVFKKLNDFWPPRIRVAQTRRESRTLAVVAHGLCRVASFRFPHTTVDTLTAATPGRRAQPHMYMYVL